MGWVQRCRERDPRYGGWRRCECGRHIWCGGMWCVACNAFGLFVRIRRGCHVSLMIQVSHLSGPGVVLGKATRVALLVGRACSDPLHEPDLALDVNFGVQSAAYVGLCALGTYCWAMLATPSNTSLAPRPDGLPGSRWRPGIVCLLAACRLRLGVCITLPFGWRTGERGRLASFWPGA